jgi:hypothetical protein
MSMVFLNAFTGKVDAEAKRPPSMSPEVFALVEAACRAGRAYDVATEMLAIMEFDPHHDCFLVPSKP